MGHNEIKKVQWIINPLNYLTIPDTFKGFFDQKDKQICRDTIFITLINIS